jgi:hypothetical protein
LSFDGEIDEEELLNQELDGLALASPLPSSSTLESPIRRTVKPALSPAVFAKSNAAKMVAVGDVGHVDLQDDEDDDDDPDEDDDFAY